MYFATRKRWFDDRLSVSCFLRLFSRQIRFTLLDLGAKNKLISSVHKNKILTRICGTPSGENDFVHERLLHFVSTNISSLKYEIVFALVYVFCLVFSSPSPSLLPPPT